MAPIAFPKRNAGSLSADYRQPKPNYFDTMAIALRQHRLFDGDDDLRRAGGADYSWRIAKRSAAA